LDHRQDAPDRDRQDEQQDERLETLSHGRCDATSRVRPAERGHRAGARIYQLKLPSLCE
jgi:hypothetical protein